MPKEAEKDRVKRWFDRIEQADKLYKDWETRFRCADLTDYWEGYQWKQMGIPEEEAKKKYTLNLVFPTIEIQLPSLLFYTPKATIDPRPAHQDDAGSQAGDRAKLCEDTVQTFIDDPGTAFKFMTTLAMRDAEFRFGVAEVGYSADWLDNPNAGKPLLQEDSDKPVLDDKQNPVTQPNQVPREGSEAIFVKYVPAEQFRVSISQKNLLSQNDWCGYFEWVYTSDLKGNKKYSNTARLKPSGEVQADRPTDDPDHEQHKGMSKVWKIWDLRQKQKYVLVEGHDKFLVDGEAYKYLPLATLKYYERLNHWYPLPPVFNWISPQDEYNEARDQQKNHRRRFNRRYSYHTGSYDESEVTKLADGADGTVVKRNTDQDTFTPVADAPLDGAIWNQLAVTRADFMQISGVGGDARGAADDAGTQQDETATEANIQEQRLQLRESAGRHTVADWLAEICRLMLECAVEKMQLPFWIQRNVDVSPASQPPNPQMLMADPQAAQTALMAMMSVQQQVQKTATLWQQITTEQMGSLNFDVKVDVASLSPVSSAQQRNDWNNVLALITNPALAMIFAQSDVMLRKTLGFYGIKSEAEIQELKRVMTQMLMMQMMAQAAAAQQPGTGGPGGAGKPSKQAQQPAGVPAGGPTVQ